MAAEYYEGQNLSCGHVGNGGPVFWASTADNPRGGTQCFDDALRTERAGGQASLIPTPGQSLDQYGTLADQVAAGIGTN